MYSLIIADLELAICIFILISNGTTVESTFFSERCQKLQKKLLPRGDLMAASGLHISLSAETLFDVAGFSVTNSMLTSLIASGILILFAIAVRLSFSGTGRPKGIQNFAEWIVEMLYNLIHGVTESTKKTEQFFPYIASFFLFILLNNWIGLLPGVGTIGIIKNESEEIHASQPEATQQFALIPIIQAQEDHAEEQPIIPAEDETLQFSEEELPFAGELHDDSLTTEDDAHAEVEEHGTFVPLFRAGTADLNMTIALAIFTQALAQWFGFSALGFGYFKKFINFSNPIMMFVGILEFLGEFTKVVSFAFRLFGNVFAGEVLLAVIAFLLPIIAPMPFYGLELFVGMIQSLVFAMLSLVFYNIATMGHGEEH